MTEKLLLGIDLGTSSVKAALVRLNGEILHAESEKYDIAFPAEGFEEESPALWWEKTVQVLRRLTQQTGPQRQIAGVGFSGQMHGLVALGRDHMPLMPCIIWSDGRSGELIKKFECTIDLERYYEQTANLPSTGFMLFSLLWLKENRPELFGKIHKVLFPKDYLRMKLTGEIGTDVTDASGSGMLDMRKERLICGSESCDCLYESGFCEESPLAWEKQPYRNWNAGLCEQLGIPLAILPDIHDSCMTAGTVSREASRLTGLPEGIPVVYGSGDSMAQQLGVGAVRLGDMVSNIGTGSQITCLVSSQNTNGAKELNRFVHSIHGLDILSGASLNGGIVMKWINNKVFSIDSFDQLVEIAAGVEPGAGGVGFIPYLSGERCPYRSDTAAGMFYGLKLAHGKEHMCRAALEGMIYALRDNLVYIEKSAGISPEHIIASGGGAKNPFLLQMQADIFRKRVRVAVCEEQACLGAALYAGVGCGLYSNLLEASGRVSRYASREYEPDARKADLYDKMFQKYLRVRDAAAHLA